MQLYFNPIASYNTTRTGARPIGLRAVMGWIALCLLPVCMVLISALPALGGRHRGQNRDQHSRHRLLDQFLCWLPKLQQRQPGNQCDQ